MGGPARQPLSEDKGKPTPEPFHKERPVTPVTRKQVVPARTREQHLDTIPASLLGDEQGIDGSRVSLRLIQVVEQPLQMANHVSPHHDGA